jgi:hypothetical protein
MLDEFSADTSHSHGLVDCDLNEIRPIAILEATLHFRE